MWVKMRRLAHGFTSALVPRDGNPTRKRGADCSPSLTCRVMIGSFQSAARVIAWFPLKIALRIATKTVKLSVFADRYKWVPRESFLCQRVVEMI
jgi:hypothetical protein